jgi:hypothetical protein
MGKCTKLSDAPLAETRSTALTFDVAKYMRYVEDSDMTEAQGRVLVRDEPIASIIQEGMGGFASGRFRTQAEVKRFFESRPEFARSREGQVRNQLANNILTKSLYAGYVEGPPSWDVPLRKGRHEGFVTFEVFDRIQTRFKGRSLRSRQGRAMRNGPSPTGRAPIPIQCIWRPFSTR